LAKTLYDVAVVDNFVVAVDRWFEDLYHPGKGLYGFFHASTEPARFG
jgi:hypothetical protein